MPIYPGDREKIAHTVAAIGRESVVKVDAPQRRFFVVRRSVSPASARALAASVSASLAGSSWQDRWSVSIFSKAELAGYKDDPAILPFHARDEWAKGYLAEIDARQGTLTFSPARSARAVPLKL